ncbi:MAG: CBS domain-containing protein [Candidatus Hydrogenedentota bacterium]
MDDLLATRVSEIMVSNVISIKKNEKIVDVASLMIKHHINALPVLDDENKLRGIVSTYDLLLILAVRTFNRNMSIESVFQTAGKPLSIYEDQTLADVITLLLKQHIKTIPVINRDGQLTGVISVSTILEYIMKKSR